MAICLQQCPFWVSHKSHCSVSILRHQHKKHIVQKAQNIKLFKSNKYLICFPYDYLYLNAKLKVYLYTHCTNICSDLLSSVSFCLCHPIYRYIPSTTLLSRQRVKQSFAFRALHVFVQVVRDNKAIIDRDGLLTCRHTNTPLIYRLLSTRLY